MQAECLDAQLLTEPFPWKPKGKDTKMSWEKKSANIIKTYNAKLEKYNFQSLDTSTI